MGKDNYGYFKGFYNYHERLIQELENSYIKNSGKMTISEFVKEKRATNADFKRCYHIIIDEINFAGYLGLLAVYSLCMQELNNDPGLVKEFMLSSYGGYTKSEHSNAKNEYKWKYLQYHEENKIQQRIKALEIIERMKITS